MPFSSSLMPLLLHPMPPYFLLSSFPPRLKQTPLLLVFFFFFLDLLLPSTPVSFLPVYFVLRAHAVCARIFTAGNPESSNFRYRRASSSGSKRKLRRPLRPTRSRNSKGPPPPGPAFVKSVSCYADKGEVDMNEKKRSSPLSSKFTSQAGKKIVLEDVFWVSRRNCRDRHANLRSISTSLRYTVMAGDVFKPCRDGVGRARRSFDRRMGDPFALGLVSHTPFLSAVILSSLGRKLGISAIHTDHDLLA